MNNNTCKRCGSDHYIMNGKVRSQQRYKCKDCGCNFVFGDKREKLSPAARALATLLYGRGKASYGLRHVVYSAAKVGNRFFFH